MNHFSRVFVGFLLGIVGLLLAASTVLAGTGGRYQSQNLEYVYNTTWTLQANVSYTIKATATGATDPILHVQLRTSGDFLAGNDDYSGLSPQVTIPAVGYARNVWIVVRAYSASTEGTATFQIIRSGSTYTTTIPVQAGKVFTNLSSYRLGSHFFTVEEQGGAENTMIMALSGNQETGIAYDQSDCVGSMSWIHTPAACTQGCNIFVAKRDSSGGGLATVVWDEDMHIAGGDTDGDGASNVLEAALTTDPELPDTDGDGLEDMAEVMGVDTADELLRLPYYGADPKRPDVFVEADWLRCDTGVGDDCGPASDPDHFRFLAANATALRAKYQDPRPSNDQIATHIDNGIENVDPATRTNSGAWDGAIRQTTWTNNKCEWGNPTRNGYFHFARVFAGGGQAPAGGHVCLDASNAEAGGTFAHELGHNFNLTEQASQSGTVESWCKPNYRSVMNYAVNAANHDFSVGEFSGVLLNPTVMNESVGLGTTSASLLDHIDRDIPNSKFGYLTGKNGGLYTGQIDWNRDGQFGGIVRAAPNWTFSSCQVGGYQADMGVWNSRSGSALAWAQPWFSSGRFYWFARNPSNSHIEYRVATSFPENCGTPPSEGCKTNWYPPVTQGWGTDVPASASGAPAVARYTLMGSDRLLLVYPSTYGYPMYRIFDPSTNSWTAQTSMPGLLATQGELAATTYGDDAYVYGIGAADNILYKWRLSSSGVWSGPNAQYWSGGSSPILAVHGIGVTAGQYRENNTPSTHMFAAIPLQTSAGWITFAWNDPGSSNYWTALRSTDWAIGTGLDGRTTFEHPTTKAQPGLAYVPFDPNVPTGPGRFYLAWTPSSGPGVMQLVMTEGNDRTTGNLPRQLRWEPIEADLESDWSVGVANISLHYDLDYDTNLRGSFTKDYGGWTALTFEPFADGIFNNVMGDQDDYPVLLENLDAYGIPPQ